jgi:hypothetical protein
MMMQWGCDLADQLSLPGWVEASIEGQGLYRTFGFEVYEILKEENGDLPGCNMKRQPKLSATGGGKPMLSSS